MVERSEAYSYCWTCLHREFTMYLILFSFNSWYPPGHGDFYESFKNSGLLRKFIDSVSWHTGFSRSFA